ncbi:hypothetical protein BMS3Bbin01_03047 [bacterium BMS3Bbin01]|nr:hypothetical protein BMS3Bbin01_03047 [bacterium BMS3Bbin01]
MALSAQFLEHGDGVGNAALDRVDRVDEEKAVVGKDLRVGSEGIDLASSFCQEQLDQRMRVRPLRRNTEHRRRADVRTEIGATDQRGACPCIGASFRSPAHPEFEYRPSPACLVYSRSLGGDKRRIVQTVEERRFQHLRHGERSDDHRDRHVAMDDASFRDRGDAEPREVPVCPQPAQKVVGEQALPGSTGQCSQVIDIGVPHMGFLHPVEQPFESRVDCVPCLMFSVVRVRAKVVIELCGLFMHTEAVVHLRHGELIQVGEQEPFCDRPLVGIHHHDRTARIPPICDGVGSGPGSTGSSAS